MKKELGETEQELRHLTAYFGQIVSEKQAQRSLLLIQGILESKSVNLWSCAEALGRRKDIEYTSEQLYGQYLDHFQTGNFDKLLKVYFLAVFYQTFPWAKGELVMDRTEWQLGKQWHNLLVIGYICHDSLVPLVWVDLGTRKCSSETERIELLDRLRAWWRATGIPMPPLMLYADREFIGSDWFKALVKRDIEFVIRLKENQSFYVWRDGKMSHKAYNIKVIARYLKRYGLSHLDIVVGDELVFPFTYAEQVIENQKISTWYLAANIQEPKMAAQRYAFRWTIEDTFGHFKTKGLNLEDFNLQGQHKLEIMMGLVTIVYALSIHHALNEDLIKDVPLKKSKNGVLYQAKATFKLGLEAIRRFVQNVNELLAFIFQIIDAIIIVCKTRKFILKKSIVQ
jgi:Transposase DDE domain